MEGKDRLNKYKKAITDLKNYQPISLLLVLYTWFSKVTTKRMSDTLDSKQFREEAGFSRGFTTMDHIQTVKHY